MGVAIQSHMYNIDIIHWIPTPSARALDDAVVRFQALRTCVDTLWIKSRDDETAPPRTNLLFLQKIQTIPGCFSHPYLILQILQ
jgi:hypothetical protein